MQYTVIRRHWNVKKLIAVLLAVCMLSVNGCNIRKEWSSKVTLSEPIIISMRICWKLDTPQGKNIKRIVDNYNLRHHEEQTVELTGVSDDVAYDTELRSMVAANQLPDVFIVKQNPNDLSIQLSGKLMDFSSYFVFKNNAQGILQKTGIWFEQPKIILYYNKRLLKQAGYESIPENWPSFLDLCGKLSKQDSTALAMVTSKASEMPLDLLFMIAQTLPDFDFKKEADWVHCLQLWKLCVAPVAGDGVDYSLSTELDHWEQGKTAMLIGSSSLQEGLKSRSDIGIKEIQTADKNVLCDATKGWAAAIQKDETKKSAVLDFLQYLIEQEDGNTKSTNRKETLRSRLLNPKTKDDLQNQLEKLLMNEYDLTGVARRFVQAMQTGEYS